MAVVVSDWLKAQGWAKHTSTFSRDQRCTEVVAVTGPDYLEVETATKMLFDNRPNATDYDINQCFENDQWVGVIVEDIDES